MATVRITTLDLDTNEAVAYDEAGDRYTVELTRMEAWSCGSQSAAQGDAYLNISWDRLHESPVCYCGDGPHDCGWY